ncbi:MULTISPECIES: hypothetical protein [Rhizobium]|uniref:hypothetical protein n=1 Tax=Rhizobium TaxID=379 RepID=UPI001FE20283|nr:MULTISPECIES: hypothetical protein [Rhizobium]MDV4156403.1 hypothetical protein [Rhizobium brockwellii]
MAVFMNSPAQFGYENGYFKFWLNFTFLPEAKVKREGMILRRQARLLRWRSTGLEAHHSKLDAMRFKSLFL